MPYGTTTSAVASKRLNLLPKSFPGKMSQDQSVINACNGVTIFSQGSRADSVYFVMKGRVKLSVDSADGKEAVLAIIGPRSFFGEGSLAEQSCRMNTATTLEPATLLRIEKGSMLRALHESSELSEMFTNFLVQRNLGLQEDISDHLFNHSENRLARVLLKLASMHGHEGQPDVTLPRLSHETLSQMVGTTRSRITHFISKFRKLGLIEGNGQLVVKTKQLAEAAMDR